MIDIMYWNNHNTIDSIVRYLRSDAVIAGASDTVFGLFSLCSAVGADALNRIKMRENKPFIILIESKNVLLRLINRDTLLHIENIIDICWPGPVTIIVPAKQEIPSFMKSPHNTIAVRIPAHAGLQAVLQQINTPLFSTSANLTGQLVPTSLRDIDRRILDAVQYVVVDKEDQQFSIIPSTILDCTGNIIKVVREGAYPITLLKQQLNI